MKRLDCDGRDITDLPGLWGDDDRVIYTPDEAMAMIPQDGAMAYLGGSRRLGASWSREVLREAFDRDGYIQACKSLNGRDNRALVFHLGSHWWLVETAAPPQLGSPGEAEVANATLLD